MKIDFASMNVGDKAVLPSQMWDDTNRAAFQQASEYAAQNPEVQFAVLDKPLDAKGIKREYWIERTR